MFLEKKKNKHTWMPATQDVMKPNEHFRSLSLLSSRQVAHTNWRQSRQKHPQNSLWVWHFCKSLTHSFVCIDVTEFPSCFTKQASHNFLWHWKQYTVAVLVGHQKQEVDSIWPTGFWPNSFICSIRKSLHRPWMPPTGKSVTYRQTGHVSFLKAWHSFAFWWIF